MKKGLVAGMIIAVLFGTNRGHSQNLSIGANIGMSIIDGSAGFHLTPVAEYLFNRSMGIGSEFSVNTQYSSPMLWHPYFKYYFNIHGSGLRPYAKAGPVLTLKVPNAPCFGILFGGGINLPIASRLYIAPDVMLGPIFGVGGGTQPFILPGVYWEYNAYSLGAYSYPSVTVFLFSVRAGIRYEL